MYYTYKVEKNIDESGTEIFEVIEYDLDGQPASDTVDKVFVNEVDATLHAFFMNAWQKYGNYDLATLSTAKHAMTNNLRPINLHIPFFDNSTGNFDSSAFFSALWGKI